MQVVVAIALANRLLFTLQFETHSTLGTIRRGTLLQCSIQLGTQQTSGYSSDLYTVHCTLHTVHWVWKCHKTFARVVFNERNLPHSCSSHSYSFILFVLAVLGEPGQFSCSYCWFNFSHEPLSHSGCDSLRRLECHLTQQLHERRHRKCMCSPLRALAFHFCLSPSRSSRRGHKIFLLPSCILCSKFNLQSASLQRVSLQMNTLILPSSLPPLLPSSSPCPAFIRSGDLCKCGPWVNFVPRSSMSQLIPRSAISVNKNEFANLHKRPVSFPFTWRVTCSKIVSSG